MRQGPNIDALAEAIADRVAGRLREVAIEQLSNIDYGTLTDTQFRDVAAVAFGQLLDGWRGNSDQEFPQTITDLVARGFVPLD